MISSPERADVQEAAKGSKVGAVVVRNSSFSLAAQIAIKVLSFGFSVLIVRRLGAYDFGQYSAIIAFTTAFAFLSDLGLGTYTIRQVARLRDQPGGQREIELLYANVIRMRTLLAAGTIVVISLAAWISGQPEVMIGAIALNSLGLVLYGVQGASDAVLSGFERLDIGANGKIFNQIVFVFLGAAALFLGWGYYGLVGASLIGVALMTLYCWRAVRALGVHAGLGDRRQWLSLLRASLPFGVITLALGLSYKFDTILMATFRSPDEVGYYNSAYNLVFSAVILSNVINTSLYPTLSRQSVTSPERLPVFYERALRYLMLLALPVAIGGWALAGKMIPLLYGAEFAPAALAMQIVIWVVPFMYASEFLGYIVVIANREKIVARSVIISTLVNISLNSLFVPRYGLIAASVMTVVTEVVLVGQYLWILRAQLARINLVKGFLKPLMAAVLMGAVLLLVREPLGFLWSFVVGVVVYGGLLLLFGVVGIEDVRFFRDSSKSSDPSVNELEVK